MAISCYKYCDECAFFFDCKNVYGKGFPPCYDTIVKNFNSVQQLKAEIRLLLSEIECDERGIGQITKGAIANRLRELSAV
jgi:hypothetical protein